MKHLFVRPYPGLIAGLACNSVPNACRAGAAVHPPLPTRFVTALACPLT